MLLSEAVYETAGPQDTEKYGGVWVCVSLLFTRTNEGREGKHVF
jgi:hypothetical protein